MALPSMTLAELRLAAQQRADMVDSDFVSDSEWTSYINGSLYELYDLLVDAFGTENYVSSSDSTTTGSADTLSLPADFYRLVGVDYLPNGASSNQGAITLRKFNFAERNRLGPNAGSAVVAAGWWTDVRYRVRGSSLWFTPYPPGGMVIRVWYIPKLSALTSESASFDGISGWLDYVVVDAARKAKEKEESDTRPLEREKEGLRQRIMVAASKRDPSEPATVSDVYATGNGGPDWGW
jgi:hypothetical protein